MRLRRRVLAERLIGGPDGDANRRFDERFGGETSCALRRATDPLGGDVERLAHRDVLALASRRRWRSSGEQIIVQKSVDRLGDGGLAPRFHRFRSGLPFGTHRPQQRPGRADDAGDQCEDDRGGGDDARAVAAEHFARTVEAARGTGEDRLVVEMAKDVECERVRGFISPHTILFDRLHRDPVEITRDRASKRAHVRTPVGRRDRRILHAAGDSAARPRRLLLPQLSLDLGHAGPAQLLGIEWLMAGEQFVEQHAERIHVRARVDVEIGHLGLFGTHVLGRADHLSELGVDRVLSQPLRRWPWRRRSR